MAYRPTISAPIQAPSSPGMPRGRMESPATAGGFGQALTAIADIGRQEVDRRIQQRQAVQLAEGRAQAQARIEEFVSGLERDPDFARYPVRWEEARTGIEESLHQTVTDPAVWDVLGPELTGMFSRGSMSVRDMAYAREDDHNLATLNASNATILESAVRPGTDHEANLELLGRNLIEARNSGLISAVEAEEQMRTLREAYRYQQYATEIDRDPTGFHDAHMTSVPLTGSDGQALDGAFVPVPNHGGVDLGGVEPGVMAAATQAGQMFGAPLPVMSAYRSQAQQDRLREEDPEGAASGMVAEHSQHTEGTALDISTAGMSEEDKGRLVAALMAAGFRGFGEYGNHIHADMGAARTWTEFTPFVQQALDGELAAPMLPAGAEAAAGEPATFTPATQDYLPPIEGVSFEGMERLRNRLDSQMADQLAVAQHSVTTRINEEIAALSVGAEIAQPVTPAEIAGAYRDDPERAQELTQGLEQARTVSREMESLHGMSTADARSFVQEQVEALQSGGTVGIEARIARAQALQGALTQLETQREDPAAYAVSRSPQLATMFENAQTPGDWAAAIALSTESQMRFLERPDQVRPLPGPVVTSVMDSYTRETDPAQRLSMLQTLTTGDHGTAVVEQLEGGGLDPGARVILDAVQNQSVGANVAADWLGLLEDSETRTQRFEQRYPDATDRNEAVANAERVYDDDRGIVWDNRDALVGSDPATIEQLLSERDTVSRLAISLSLQDGGEPDPQAAAETLMPQLFGGEVAVSPDTGHAFVPAGQADAIENGMVVTRDSLSAIVPSEVYRQYIGLEIPELQAADVWASMVDGALWVNVDGGYAIAMPVAGPRGRLLVDGQGNVRVWTPEHLAAIGVTRPESDPAAYGAGRGGPGS